MSYYNGNYNALALNTLTQKGFIFLYAAHLKLTLFKGVHITLEKKDHNISVFEQHLTSLLTHYVLNIDGV